jgi:hypothetical protein
MKSRKLNGTICVSRPQRGDGRAEIRIELTDATSRVHFLEVSVDPAALMEAITGLGYQPCVFELRGIENVGKTAENTTGKVFVPKCEWKDRESVARSAIDAHELTAQGWFGYVSDACNHHKLTRHEDGGDWYTVNFHRFIETPNTPTE